MPEQFESRYFRGQGKLLFGDKDDATGKPTGLIFVGDMSTAELSPNMERGKVIENVSGAGAVGASYLKRTEYGLTINMRSIKAAHLAEALHATVTAKAAASVTDETHQAYLDKMTPLEHNKVSSVVITGVSGTPTYVLDTDYVVHADEGLVEFISGGTITDDTAVEIDYDYAAQKHVKVLPHNLDKYLVFAGVNSADNDKQTRCEMYKVKLDPSVLSMITDDSTDMPITGVLQLDALRPAGDQFYSWKLED